VFTSSEWKPQLCPCEGGTQIRTNTILEPSKGSGDQCPSQTETQTCLPEEGREDCVKPAAQNCIVEYGEWEPLECPCGENTQTRTNTIITPSNNGGTECPDKVEEKRCTGPPCPTHCAYTESNWENVGTCGCGD